MSFIKAIINFVTYLLTWLIAVIGAVHGYSWLGLWVSLVFVALYFVLTDSPKRELRHIVIITLIGCTIDSVLYYHKLLVFAGANPWYPLSPPWMWGIWLMFSTTFNGALAVLQRHPFITASIGAIDLPLSYLIGARYGGVYINHLITTLAILSCLWLILMPVCMWIAVPSSK